MTKKIIWRLSEKPSTESLQKLVSSGILTKEEAREILFNEVEESDRSIDSLKEEIRFLREIIEKLSSREKIVEVVKEYHYTQPWYQPYHYWTMGTTYTAATCGGNTTTLDYIGNSNSFSAISTF
jgi:hypothetical protein